MKRTPTPTTNFSGASSGVAEGVRDRETGVAGVLLDAESAGWVSEAVATVRGGYFVNAQRTADFQFRLRGSGNIFRRAGTSDTWVVEDGRPLERS